MALVLTEPFTDFTTNGWVLTSAPTIVAAGRTGNAASFVGSSARADYNIPTPSQTDTLTLGFAYKHTDASTSQRTLVAFYSDSGVTAHNLLIWTTGGTLVYQRGGLTIVTSEPVTMLQNEWYYIEVQTRLHDTAGSVTVRIEGVTVLSATGLDTKNAGTKTVYDQVRLFPALAAGTELYEDLYLRNDAVFQGDPRVGGAAQLARLSERSLIVGTPAARLAQIYLRALTRVGITDANLAQIALRALIVPTAAGGASMKVWNGAAFVAAPVKVWNGAAFVDAAGVKTWNGAAFV